MNVDEFAAKCDRLGKRMVRVGFMLTLFVTLPLLLLASCAI